MIETSPPRRLELLAPAGTPEALDAAAACGADAVYLGLKCFNARMRSANFAWSQFEGALKVMHRMGKKIYVTVNTVFEQREADRMFQLLKYLNGVGPDGLIVQDLGVIQMVKENFPRLKLHASTQMNIASARAANALSRYGVSRVVLARELSIEEIAGVRAGCNLELECFVHGALCVSVSGLCLFSSYLGGKSANRGMCTQACRRLYQNEDGKGYFFSPADLQLLERIPELAAAGVRSFKIEGRMKSAEYVGAVVSAYRLVIDAVEDAQAAAGAEGAVDGEGVRRAITEAAAILQNDFARSKTTYLLDGCAPAGGDGGFAWLRADQAGGTGISLGTIVKVKGSGGDCRGLLSGVTLPAVGDSVRLHKADDSGRAAHKLTAVEAASGGSNVQKVSTFWTPQQVGFREATGFPETYWISIPDGYGAGDAVYLIQTQAMTRRYPPVIPKDLSPFKRKPGREQAPSPVFTDGVEKADTAPQSGKTPRRNRDTEHSRAKRGAAERGAVAPMPEGLYAAVSRTDELYVLQADKPAMAILALTPKNLPRLLDKAPLPFRKDELILSLDPFFPQGADEFFTRAASDLAERGYRYFMLNNPGHFSLFRGLEGGPELIAGPYLYTFNRWAAAFVQSLGARRIVSPLENNRQNLEKTTEDKRRASVFVPVFAWPALFRMRPDVQALYGFQGFGGSRGEDFTLISYPGCMAACEGSGSAVIPAAPFSIVDKIPFLEQAGFRRFILDFQGPPLKKKDYRGIMKAARTGAPLSGISRFNWKDGFYREPASSSV